MIFLSIKQKAESGSRDLWESLRNLAQPFKGCSVPSSDKQRWSLHPKKTWLTKKWQWLVSSGHFHFCDMMCSTDKLSVQFSLFLLFPIFFSLFNTLFCMQEIVLSTKFNDRYLWDEKYLTKFTSTSPKWFCLSFSVCHISFSILEVTENKACNNSKTYKIVN